MSELVKNDTLKDRVYYKYKNPEFGLSLLKKCQIKVTTPRQLNDVYELFPYPDIDEDAVANELLYGHWRPEFTKHLRLEGYGINTLAELLRWKNENPELFKMKVTQMQAIVKEVIDNTISEMSRHTAVYSMTTNPIQNVMWGFYGAGYRGICVGFQFKDMDRDTTLVQVCYESNRPSISLKELTNRERLNHKIVELLATKSKEWSFESEYRFLFGITDPIDQDLLLFPIEPTHIREIYLGPRVEKQLLDEIKEILGEERYRHVDLYQVERGDKNTFDLVTRRMRPGLSR